uniref:RRM domain-containing protein n=1 Tax=Macrostomum lignano TaxID=282301 RepID=A0A1I8G1N2_9PLAT
MADSASEAAKPATGGGKKGKKQNKGTKMHLTDFIGENVGVVGKLEQQPARPAADWGEVMEEEDPGFVGLNDLLSLRRNLPAAPKAATKPDLDLSKVPKQPPFKVYVGSLPFDTSEENVAKFFKDLDVVEIDLLRNERNSLRGFGYVTLRTAEDMIKALQMSDRAIGTRRIKIDFVDNQAGQGQQAGGKGRPGRDGLQAEMASETDNNWRKSARPPPPSSPANNGFTGGRGGGRDSRDGGMSRPERRRTPSPQGPWRAGAKPQGPPMRVGGGGRGGGAVGGGMERRPGWGRQGTSPSRVDADTNWRSGGGPRRRSPSPRSGGGGTAFAGRRRSPAGPWRRSPSPLNRRRRSPSPDPSTIAAAQIQPIAVTQKAIAVAERAIPVTEKAIPVTEKAIPVTEKAIPVTEKAIAVAERAIPVTEKAIPVAEKAIPVAEKAISVTEDRRSPPRDRRSPPRDRRSPPRNRRSPSPPRQRKKLVLIPRSKPPAESTDSAAQAPAAAAPAIFGAAKPVDTASVERRIEERLERERQQQAATAGGESGAGPRRQHASSSSSRVDENENVTNTTAGVVASAGHSPGSKKVRQQSSSSGTSEKQQQPPQAPPPPKMVDAKPPSVNVWEVRKQKQQQQPSAQQSANSTGNATTAAGANRPSGPAARQQQQPQHLKHPTPSQGASSAAQVAAAPAPNSGTFTDAPKPPVSAWSKPLSIAKKSDDQPTAAQTVAIEAEAKQEPATVAAAAADSTATAASAPSARPVRRVEVSVNDPNNPVVVAPTASDKPSQRPRPAWGNQGRTVADIVRQGASNKG